MALYKDMDKDKDKGVQGEIEVPEIVPDEKYFVPQMQKIFSDHVATHTPRMEVDIIPLLAIANYLRIKVGKKAKVLECQPEILALWGKICKYIPDDNFYRLKGLKTISNNIEEIYNKSIYGTDTNKKLSPSGTGKNAGAEQLLAKAKADYDAYQRRKAGA